LKRGFLLAGDYSAYEKEMQMSKQLFAKLGIEIDIVDFNDINVIASDNPEGKVFIRGKEVDYPDFVMVVTVDERDDYKFRAVLRMFETLGINCINTVDAIEKAGDKIYSFQIANQFVPEIKMPKTILISPDVPMEMIEEQVGFPLVLKIMDGNQGRGVGLIQTKEELENILNIVTASEFGQELMVQEAILSSAGRDIRLVVAGGEVIHSFVRRNDDDFKSNLHQGGSLETFEAPQSLIDSSIKLADAFGLKLGSIDYLFGENEDEFYLCEVNSVPGISYIFDAQSKGDDQLIQKVLAAISRITS
jgi:gamma-F420-2:alpha-L-glutamate ligase